jgi:hypothetical protein
LPLNSEARRVKSVDNLDDDLQNILMQSIFHAEFDPPTRSATPARQVRLWVRLRDSGGTK